MKVIFTYCLLFFQSILVAQNSFEIALMKYNGGGDWYANPTALTNLINFSNTNLNTSINIEYKTVEVGSEELFNYPLLHLTGHGNIVFSSQEAENLRNYLMAGGFIHVSDNYGMDQYFRLAIKAVFPDQELVELPFSHAIYHQEYEFHHGLPKIHQHDEKAPIGYGLFYKGRLVVFHDYECDLSDGWEDASVHNDSEEKRQQALKMGVNILQFAFGN